MSNLLDEADRDAAINDLTKSIFLGAGAGAGKSTTLIARIVEALTNPQISLQIEEIVAITFTEKAGTDLRQRLRRAIIEENSNRKNPALEAALRSLEDAKVGTIHSFAQSILREFAIEAGLPPGFQVLTEGTSSRAKKQRCRDVLTNSKILKTESSLLNNPVLKISNLLKLVTDLDEVRLLINEDSINIKVSPNEDPFNIFKKAYGLFKLKVEEEFTGPQTDLLFLAIQSHFDILDEMEFSYSNLNKLQWLEENQKLLSLPGNKGSAANWQKGTKEIRESWLTVAEKLVKAMKADFDKEVYEFISESISLLDEMAKQRAHEGFLEFDDLLSLTRNLLRTDEGVRKRLHEKYKFVLVDEFQDTDPVQWEIVKIITSDPALVEAPKPLPGRLLVVGDPKQAIFSFRGADIATYQRARSEFEEFGIELNLSTNFRSTPEIIEWVNGVFESAMNQPAQVKYEALTASRSNLDKKNPSVTVLRAPADTKDFKSTEAKMIANSVARAVVENWQVSYKDGDETKQRNAKFSDIAIIYPTRTSIDNLLSEFEAVGIPYRAADSRLVLDRPIIKGLVALIRSIADESDEISTWSVLKTPIFGCTDTDLYEYKKLKGRWSGFYEHEKNVEAAQTYVGQCILKINNLRMAHNRSSPTELIDAICRELSLFEITSVSPRGGFDADCVMMLRNFAQDWQDEGGSGILEFCDTIDEIEAPGSRVNFASPDDISDDAVRLMTIFGAKGLEFPIVAVSGQSVKTVQDKSSIGIKPNGRIEFHFAKNLESAGWSEWNENTRQPNQIAERIRVLYVAATRAQDALIFSLVSDQAADKWASLISPFIPNSDADISSTLGQQVQYVGPAPIKGLQPEWENQLATLRMKSAQPYVALPSGLAASVFGLVAESNYQPEEIVLRGNTSINDVLQTRDGAARGQACHSALDYLMNYHDEINEDAFKLAVDSAMASVLTVVNEDEVLAIVNKAFNSDIYQKALKAERKWPELYLSAPVEHEHYKLVEGFADLVFQDQDGYTIVDYKTDNQIKPETLKHYEEQLLSYEELFKRCTGQNVFRLCILHITVNGAKELEIIRN